MMRPRSPRHWLRYTPIVLALAAGLWQASLVVADGPPRPNPLAPSTDTRFAPVPGADITANGPAASMHGDPLNGRRLFALNCVTCHNDRGVGGLPNPGSDDGTVPSLNPMPEFVDDSQGNPTALARDIDLFVQHGSRPAGTNPQVSMIGWGDHQLLSQQDLADLEAYLMSLNGVYWPDRWAPPADVHIQATRADGDVSYVTYRIWVVNQGAGPLGSLDLVDALPPGLTPITTYVPEPGQNPASVSGNTVEWNNPAGVPQGGVFGPFVILAQLQDPRATVAPNSAWASFTWQTWNGVTLKSSAASGPVVAAAAPATAAAPSAPPVAVAAGVKIVQAGLEVLTWGYAPETITIKAGDTVTWTNDGSIVHTVTPDDGSFDSGVLNKGDVWTHTFDKSGSYTYHCTPHPWMKATVVVEGG
jgi:plastocyanin/mono/diheme cytochrome c family protein